MGMHWSLYGYIVLKAQWATLEALWLALETVWVAMEAVECDFV